MKIRTVQIFSGTTFEVPQRIQRIDTKSTHGWQVRYNGTKFFKDGSSDGTGAPQSLQDATRELIKRLASMPAPVALKRSPSAHKTSGLPPGISGPIVARRSEQGGQTASLSVLIPRFGEINQIKSIYIASEATYTAKKFKAALAKAVELRAEAVAHYEVAAAKAMRKEASALRQSLRQGQGGGA
jgi:hypothetical protein